MGCNTSGIEPATSLSIKKNLAGGGHVILANEDVDVALEHLGYNEEQIKDISNFVGKYNTLIDAPYLNPEHYRIFDTAQGVKGKGSISLDGHMKMMGAVQPFISGAISKTNNLPENAKVKDFYDAYILGNKLELKGITFFRDNSKPISALGDSKSHKKLGRGEKEELPFSGDSFRQEVKIDGTSFLINIGEYIDGRPGEVVINSFTSDSTLGAIIRSAGIGASSALKRGSSLEDVFKGWIGHGFEPRGFVTVETPEGKIVPHPYIKQVSSPLDFVGKLALLHYKGQTDLATEPNKVNLRDLRGAKTGAFRTYKRMKINDWKFEDVINDFELGGFVEPSEDDLIMSNGKNENNKITNRGIPCRSCGRLMEPTGPNCYQCGTCGEKSGGCGA
jgi:ribonucleoside-diphosphate reductase alpha chain